MGRNVILKDGSLRFLRQAEESCDQTYFRVWCKRSVASPRKSNVDGSTEFALGVMFRVVTLYSATFTVYVLSAIALLPLESHLSFLSSNRVLR